MLSPNRARSWSVIPAGDQDHPLVDLEAGGGDIGHGQQGVTGAEHPIEELLGIAHRAQGHLLFETPDVLRDDLESLLHTPNHRRDDRVGHLRRGAWQEAALEHAVPHQGRVPHRDVRGHGRVRRAVDGDQVVRCDELIQLHVVHVPVLPQFGGVQHDEDMVGVRVELGHPLSLLALPDRHRMETEDVAKHAEGLLVEVGHVHPDDRLRVGQGGWQGRDRHHFSPTPGDDHCLHGLASSSRSMIPPATPAPAAGAPGPRAVGHRQCRVGRAVPVPATRQPQIPGARQGPLSPFAVRLKVI